MEITPEHPLWPQHLKTKQMYFRGQGPGKRPALTAIGTRQITAKMNEYADIALRSLTRSQPEVSIISGLALGCDAAFHHAALRHGLHTVAVLPGSIDQITPASHKDLAEKIVQAGGALMSTRPPGHHIQKKDFVERDFIQAEMGSALLLLGTGVTGGSWYATRHAAKKGKPIGVIKPASDEKEHPSWQGNAKLGKAITENNIESLSQWLHLPAVEARKLKIDLLAPQEVEAWASCLR